MVKCITKVIRISDLNSFTDSSGRKVEQKLLRKVLKQVCNKKAAFATEIAHFTNQDPDEIALILRQLKQAGILEVLKPKMKNGDKRLMSASKRTGKNSIDQMRQPTWYGLNSDLDWEIKHSSKDIVVNEYHEEIKNPNGTDQNILDMAVKRMEANGEMF